MPSFLSRGLRAALTAISLFFVTWKRPAGTCQIRKSDRIFMTLLYEAGKADQATVAGGRQLAGGLRPEDETYPHRMRRATSRQICRATALAELALSASTGGYSPG